MDTTIDFNVLSVFMSFESVTYLHYFVGSDRSLHNFFTHSTASFCHSFHVISILLKEARVCVCVFAKLDQFLPVRSQFDSNQHVNYVRIATSQCANFGPLLFAFYCPLLFLRKKNKE